MAEKIIYPRFIETSPCGEDLFESGAQKKTATSIAEVIRKGTSHYRLIGLDGSWGAGKSNVISIIKKDLGDTHHLFVYDAWSHQEDLQRRSFLEGLTDDLQQHHIVDQEEWKEKLKKLLAKKKETVQHTVPKLSYAIIVAFLATILTPITTAISGMFKEDDKLWKILLAGSPILIALLIWGIAARKNKKYRNFLDLFYIYKEKDLETVTNEVITESEPSVREFRNWMFDLENSLKKDIIIVFDNMDRLPPEKVQSLWSSIHTFFSENNAHKRIWVVVPFDRAHITEAFSKDAEKSNHFINKTFSVIFRVPPAVLTDWWDFFELKFFEAFGEDQRSEYSIVKGVFDRYQFSITPRKVIAFINELVTLKLTWDNTMPLRYMALFLVNKDLVLNDPVSIIINKGYRSKVAELFPEDHEVDDNIAALVYNVPKETATQVTLQREIILAIRENDMDLLDRLQKHKDFFKILEEIYAREEDMDFKVSVNALNEITYEQENAYAHNVLQSIWSKLALKQRNIAIDELSFAETQQILLSNCPEHNRIPLIKYLAAQYSISRNFKGDDFFKTVDALDDFIRDKKWDIKLPDHLRRTSMQPEQFVTYVQVAKENYEYFEAYCDNIQLENHFVGKFDKDWEGTQILEFIKKNYKFPALKKKVEEYMASDNVTLTNVTRLLEIYRNLSEDRILSVRIPDEKIDTLLSETQGNSNEYYELAAMRIARGDSWEGTSNMSETILSNSNEEEIKQISTRIESFSNLGDLIKLTVRLNQPLLNAVVKELIQRSKGTSRMSILEIVPLFDKIIEIVGVTDTELVERLNGWSKHFKDQLTEEKLATAVPSLSIYSACLKTKNDFSSHLFATAISYIEKIEEERWQQILSDENSYEFKLVGFLLKNEVISSFPNKLLEPYKQRLASIAEETEPLPHDRDVWAELYYAVDKRQIKATIKNVRDSFISKGNINGELFLLFEEMLRITGSLDERSGDVIRRIITPVIQNESCLDTIIHDADFYLSLFSHSGEERIEFVKSFRKAQEQRPGVEFINKFSNGLDGLLAGKLSIKQASYYTDEFSADVTEKMKQVVEREGVLHFKIDNGIVDNNDPHPGIPKRLSLKFDFDGKEYDHSYNEGDWLNIP